MLIKGVLTAEDGLAAIDHGAAGVIVSNHGGRQLDGAIASLDALPHVVAAIGGRGTVLVDGGIRRGADVFTALMRCSSAAGTCGASKRMAKRASRVSSRFCATSSNW